MDSIPDDILIYILEQHENIDFLDILNLSLVSKRFKTIVKLIKPEKIYKIYRKEHLFLKGFLISNSHILKVLMITYQKTT